MHNEKMTIRVMLADDHHVVRVGLRAMFSRFPQIEVVGEASSGAEAVLEAQRLKPDVVLLDVRMPDGAAFDTCRKILAMGENAHVIFLTSFADDHTIFEAISAGADGYLLKDIAPDELINAITQVAEGRSILDPAVTRRVLGRVKAGAEAPATPAGLEILSAQELRVLALVAQGMTNKEIGMAMGLSDKTVKNYLSNLLDKLNLSRRSQAAAFYVQNTLK
jgi:two-component system, NarL family, response regulator DevR